MVVYCRFDLKAAKKRRTSSKPLLRLRLISESDVVTIGEQSRFDYPKTKPNTNENHLGRGGINSTNCLEFEWSPSVWGHVRSLHYCNSHTENFWKAYRRNTRWWRKRKLYTNRRKRLVCRDRRVRGVFLV